MFMNFNLILYFKLSISFKKIVVKGVIGWWGGVCGWCIVKGFRIVGFEDGCWK